MLPNSYHQFVRKEISPKDAPITKIQVSHDGVWICGFKFYSNDKVVLETGFVTREMKEVKLEEGERLIGVKSKIPVKTPAYNTLHCNLVLMIGRLE